MQNCKINEVH